jgi:hypothetical protein
MLSFIAALMVGLVLATAALVRLCAGLMPPSKERS